MQRDLADIKRELESVAARTNGFVELRYHRKKSRTAGVENGRIEVANARRREGIAVRVIDDGCFGYASCGSAERADLDAAIERARASARVSASRRRDRLPVFPKADLVRGHFEG